MKVKKYIGILMATMLLAGFTACGGSDSNDPLNPENPDKPEPELPVDYNPMEGMWIPEYSENILNIFTKEFEWERSYRKNPDESWSDPVPYRSYRMLSKNTFRTADKLIWSFTITQEYPNEILTLDFDSDRPLRYYRVKN